MGVSASVHTFNTEAGANVETVVRQRAEMMGVDFDENWIVTF
jgi:hypothetical protein